MIRTLLDCDIHKHLAAYQNTGSVIPVGDAIAGFIIESMKPSRDMSNIIAKRTAGNLSLFLWREISRCAARGANENTAELGTRRACHEYFVPLFRRHLAAAIPTDISYRLKCFGVRPHSALEITWFWHK